MYFEIDTASGGWIWRIRGGNHEIMCSSEILSTKGACESAIRVVQENAGMAEVVDRT